MESNKQSVAFFMHSTYFFLVRSQGLFRKRYRLFLSIAFILISLFGCTQSLYNNPCDTRSNSFLLTILAKANLGDQSTHCGISALPTVSSVEPLYAGRTRWLEYIKNDGNDVVSATNTPCTGSETGGYSACIHVGEMRAVTVLFGALSPTSCNGYTAIDSEDAFQYACSVLLNGGLRIYSTSLKKGKRLGDLIERDTLSFKPLQIFVLREGALVGKSDKKVWWTNPIKRLPTTGGSLTDSYTVYTLISDASLSKLTIDAPYIAISQNSNTIATVSGAQTNLYEINRSFCFVEGRIDSAASASTIQISAGANFAYVKDVTISSTQGFMVHSIGSQGLYKNLKLHGNNSSSDGIRIGLAGNTTEALVFESVMVGFTDSNVIQAYSSASNTRFINLAFSDVVVYSGSSSEAVLFGSASTGFTEGILYRESTIAHTAIGGLIHQYAGSQPFRRITDMNISFVNNGNPSLQLFAASAIDFELTVLNFASLVGDPIVNNVNQSYFTGNFKISTGTSCNVTGGTNFGFLNTSWQKNGLSDFTFSSGLSFDSSYVGPLSKDDTSNSFDTNGLYTLGVPTNPSFYDRMENPYRAWGVSDSVTTLTAAMRGGCSSSCRINDWSLRSSDTILRNANPCPDPTKPLSHTISGSAGSDEACSAILRGAKSSAGNVCKITHLRNAVEIIGDGKGNDKLVTAKAMGPNNCSDITTGNAIENVKLFQYESNGY